MILSDTNTAVYRDVDSTLLSPTTWNFFGLVPDRTLSSEGSLKFFISKLRNLLASLDIGDVDTVWEVNISVNFFFSKPYKTQK